MLSGKIFTCEWCGKQWIATVQQVYARARFCGGDCVDDWRSANAKARQESN